MKSFFKPLFFILLCELVGLSAVPVTFSAIPTWYAGLIKPSFNPPSWIFGPVWTMLYALMGIALSLVLNAKVSKTVRQLAVRFFAVQLLFNFLWSFLFFGAHELSFALLDLTALLFSLVITLYFFRKISTVAFYLLLPYFLWSCFALVLNASILYLNK